MSTTIAGIRIPDSQLAREATALVRDTETDLLFHHIIEAFYQGIKYKPDTTFGNVKADVLELKDPHFHRGNFCQVILNSAWPS